MNSRRDAGGVERRDAPIQGSTLPDALLNGGALSKITNVLSPKPGDPKAGKSADDKAGQGKGAQGKPADGQSTQASGEKPSGGH